MLKHYKIKVLGRVQGVWFRKYAQEEARRSGITGLIRNENDGSVYIEAEGDEQRLNAFIKWCHEGSPLSEVREVKWEEDLPSQYTEFEIIR
jgi:acylphosphatase